MSQSDEFDDFDEGLATLPCPDCGAVPELSHSADCRTYLCRCECGRSTEHMFSMIAIVRWNEQVRTGTF